MPDQAILDFTSAIFIDPDYRDAFNNRGLALCDKEEYETALSDFNRAIELDPDYWYAYGNRGLAFWGLGRKDEAVLDYRTASSKQSS